MKVSRVLSPGWWPLRLGSASAAAEEPVVSDVRTRVPAWPGAPEDAHE